MSATRFFSSLVSSNESSSDLLSEMKNESEPLSVQSAIVRTLADAIKHHEAQGDAADGLREQLVEEMDRLGSCRIQAATPR
jgi:hypothetical protein